MNDYSDDVIKGFTQQIGVITANYFTQFPGVDSIKLLWKKLTGKKVILLGETGTGKTAMIRNLFHPSKPPACKTTQSADDYLAYIEDKSFIVTDSPGNKAFDLGLKPALEAISRGETLGIINVVANGFNDSRSYKHDTYTAIELNKNNRYDAKEEHIRKSKKWDIKFLNQNILENEWLHEHINFVIVAVNKYDLWSDMSKETMEYYSPDGEYGSLITKTLPKAQYMSVPCCGEPDRLFYFKESLCNVTPVGKETIDRYNRQFLGSLKLHMNGKS